MSVVSIEICYQCATYALKNLVTRLPEDLAMNVYSGGRLLMR